MSETAEMIVSWLASQSATVQLALNLALVFLIVPALLAAIAAAITKIEERIEVHVSRKYGSSPTWSISLTEDDESEAPKPSDLPQPANDNLRFIRNAKRW